VKELKTHAWLKTCARDGIDTVDDDLVSNVDNRTTLANMELERLA